MLCLANSGVLSSSGAQLVINSGSALSSSSTNNWTRDFTVSVTRKVAVATNWT